jgi:hypothetical protein
MALHYAVPPAGRRTRKFGNSEIKSAKNFGVAECVLFSEPLLDRFRWAREVPRGFANGWRLLDSDG